MHNRNFIEVFFFVSCRFRYVGTDVQIQIFDQVWEVFSQYFFKYSFCLFCYLPYFWDFQYAYIGIPDDITQVSQIVHFSSSFFSFCFSDRITSIDLYSNLFIDSFFSTCSYLLLNSSSKFFILVIVPFTSKISSEFIWALFISSVSIDILYFVSHHSSSFFLIYLFF